MVVQHTPACDEPFRRCVEGMRDGLAILSAVRAEEQILDFRYRYLNPAGAALDEISIETHLAHTLLELFPLVRRNGLFDKLVQVVETGEPLVLDTYQYEGFVGGRRTVRVYDLRAARLGDGISLTWRDVTAVVDTDRQLHCTAAIIEYSDDAIIAKTLDGVVLAWNPGAERLYGYPAGEVIGRSVTILQPSERDGEDQTMLARIARGEHVAHHDTVRVTKDGRRIDVSLSVSPVLDAQGRLMGACTIARDITERKRAEKALRDSEAYNQGLIESSPDALATIDPSGRITDVNRRMEDTTDLTRDDLIGKDFGDIFTDPTAARHGVQRVLAEGRVADYELIIEGRTGVRTPVSCNATTYTDTDGTVQGVFAVARDVTERNRAAEEILHLNADLEGQVRTRTAALERSNRELESFTYSVSHDLRSPLRALSGFAEALLEEYAETLDETGRGYAQRISDASGRMASLIDDLLLLSRVMRARPRIVTVDLSEIARTIIDELRAEDPTREVSVVIGDGVTARADRDLIRTVLENLLNNAWKFTAKRTHAHIEFGALADSPPGDEGCYVRDNGAGFDPTYADKLFQPFQRLHPLSEFPGNGIGLASVRRIVDLHGGRIWAEGMVDQGATVSFTLPNKEQRDA